MNASLISDVKYVYDVRMTEHRRGASFVLESLQLAFVQQSSKRQNLDCDSPVKGKLLRLVNDPHATAANLTNHPEIAQLLVA